VFSKTEAIEKPPPGTYPSTVSFKKYKDLSTSGVGPSLQQLFEILNNAIGSYRTVYIVVDALDECSNDTGIREEFVSALKTLQDKSSNLKLLITSRIFESIARLIESSTRLSTGAEASIVKYEEEEDAFVSGYDNFISDLSVYRRPTRTTNFTSTPIELEHIFPSVTQRIDDSGEEKVDELGPKHQPPVSYRLEIKAARKDIAKYVMGAIRRSDRLSRHVNADPALRHFIIEQVVLKSQEMYEPLIFKWLSLDRV
jgi:hypothetical protein